MAEDNLVQEAIQIIQSGDKAGVPLRLLGGLAIRLSSPSSGRNPKLRRSYADIDFVGLERDNRKIKEILKKLQYVPDEHFNALHGQTRLNFYDQSLQYHIDIFLDWFKMCHGLDLRVRLFPSYQTITLVDLLVTKLQIVQLNAKDMMDILALLNDHEVVQGEKPNAIDVDYLSQLTHSDWGLYTTLNDNLKRTRETIPDFLSETEGVVVAKRITTILDVLEETPKTMRWRLRAKIGRRMEWYELPDVVNR